MITLFVFLKYNRSDRLKNVMENFCIRLIKFKRGIYTEYIYIYIEIELSKNLNFIW